MVSCQLVNLVLCSTDSKDLNFTYLKPFMGSDGSYAHAFCSGLATRAYLGLGFGSYGGGVNDKKIMQVLSDI